MTKAKRIAVLGYIVRTVNSDHWFNNKDVALQVAEGYAAQGKRVEVCFDGLLGSQVIWFSAPVSA